MTDTFAGGHGAPSTIAFYRPDQERSILGTWVKENQEGEDANWEDAKNMSVGEWDKLSDKQRAGLLAAVYVADADGKPGASGTLAKLRAWVAGAKDRKAAGKKAAGDAKKAANDKKRAEEKKKREADAKARKAKAEKDRITRALEARRVRPDSVNSSHRDGYVLGESENGSSRMRYDKAHDSWVIENKSKDGWKESRRLSNEQAYNELTKRTPAWYRPKVQPYLKPETKKTPAKTTPTTKPATKSPVTVKQPKRSGPGINEGVVVAAAEVHTGAMIALVPREDLTASLAVDGGEDAEQLHMTEVYLGQAADISEDEKLRIIDVMSTFAERQLPVNGDAFSVNLFNPPGTKQEDGKDRDSCVVLGISGHDIAAFHDELMDTLEQAGIEFPEQHEPRIPHVTLVYTDDADLSYFTDKTGPIVFDTLRVAFGGDVYDIPLGEAREEDEAMTASGQDDEIFGLDENGVPIVPNMLVDLRALTKAWTKERDVNSGPGPGHNLRNYWIKGEGAAKIGWGTDGDWTRCVRHLSKYVKDPKGLCAEYHHQATGMWTGEKRHLKRSGDTATFDTEMLYDEHRAAEREDVADVTAASDPKKPYGDVKYADPGYQSDGKKRYPIDTEEHIRAAWSYINQEGNASKYSPEHLKEIKRRIQAALKRIGGEVNAEGAVITAASKVKTKKADEDEEQVELETPEVDDEAAEDEETEAAETTEEAPDDEAAPTAAEMDKPAKWEGVLTVEGIESGDGRMFGTNALSWDELPLPLRWQKESAHGGQNDVTVSVGNIEKIWREPAPDGRAGVNFIKGSGTIDLGNPDGAEVYRRMKRGYMRGNSVDVDSVKGADVELVFPESAAKTDKDEDGKDTNVQIFDMSRMQPELTIYKKGRIRATTLVEIPAFTEARLALAADEPQVPEETDVEQDDSLVQAVDAQIEALVAAATTITIPDLPPREWFNEPTDVQAAGALTVTAEGRIFGYVAPLGVRHRSFAGKDVTVPMKRVDYTRFMGGETIVADGGRVSTGAITMNCGHASTSPTLTASQAAQHYDNTCSMVATVRVGENRHGVWMAGALLPDVTPDQIRRIMASRLSGDWRSHLDKPGWREFVAALLVPVPGFPMARSAPSVTASEGVLVASSVPVFFAQRDDDEEEAEGPVLEENETPEDEEKEERLKSARDRIKFARLEAMRARIAQHMPSPAERAAALRSRVVAFAADTENFHGTHNQDSHGNRYKGGKLIPGGGGGKAKSLLKTDIGKLTKQVEGAKSAADKASAKARGGKPSGGPGAKTRAGKSLETFDDFRSAMDQVNEGQVFAQGKSSDGDYEVRLRKAGKDVLAEVREGRGSWEPVDSVDEDGIIDLQDIDTDVDYKQITHPGAGKGPLQKASESKYASGPGKEHDSDLKRIGAMGEYDGISELRKMDDDKIKGMYERARNAPMDHEEHHWAATMLRKEMKRRKLDSGGGGSNDKGGKSLGPGDATGTKRQSIGKKVSSADALNTFKKDPHPEAGIARSSDGEFEIERDGNGVIVRKRDADGNYKFHKRAASPTTLDKATGGAKQWTDMMELSPAEKKAADEKTKKFLESKSPILNPTEENLSKLPKSVRDSILKNKADKDGGSAQSKLTKLSDREVGLLDGLHGGNGKKMLSDPATLKQWQDKWQVSEKRAKELAQHLIDRDEAAHKDTMTKHNARVADILKAGKKPMKGAKVVVDYNGTKRIVKVDRVKNGKVIGPTVDGLDELYFEDPTDVVKG